MTRVYCALLHYPVRDRAGETVTTAVTTLDVHDIARSARTFGVRGYFVVTPIDAQHQLVLRILSHWRDGAGRARMPERHEALTVVQPLESLEAALAEVEEREGVRPRLLATGAKPLIDRKPMRFEQARSMLEDGSVPTMILFGTGHGLARSVLEQCDEVLEPIAGRTGYNHLSVRSAAAIVFDRLLGR